ncbi:hypothetical protein M3P05_14265 [Sansalvadorimonas sp. 2012CJ34-2]|uniref:Uncharacterized protein n=1 Tax=Parendozoicomonas callyspongiae TaxID=2942213 RepID=A0ABT0PIK2_9GAMM|nr:hypothetical protein [Sansalvadorimonas sp. 2012CJ34-2]MCL6271086.1 hypothetical protein [Sansalvadorimonas sp. 2012CJ34-2]
MNASGTYIRTGNGYIYAANVQPAAAVANILSNGTIGAIRGVVVSTFVLSMASAIPQAHLAIAAKYLWQYRMVAYYWDYYLNTIVESWNFRTNRVGHMPVYLSSRQIDEQVLIHWLYPLDDEKPVQLEVTLMPVEPPDKREQGEYSPTEKALQALVDRLRARKALRMKVWLDEQNLQIALQENDGRWFYRAVPRPAKVLLEEAVRNWEGRPQMPVASSLLTPSSLQYVADSLVCQESLRDGWRSSAVSVAESVANSLFEVARTEDGSCDYLAVSDMSSKVMGFAGYQHLRTGVSCGVAPLLLSRYTNSGYQDLLSSKAHNSMLPAWASTLFFRILEEGLAIGTRSAADYFWNTYAPSDNPLNLAAKWGTQQGEDVIPSTEPEPLTIKVLSQAREHAPKALTVVAPINEEVKFSSPMCVWKISPQ